MGARAGFDMTTSAENAVILTASDPRWEERFLAERSRLEGVMGEDTPIEHIGSTAIEGLMAKPYIDILVGTLAEKKDAHCLRALQALGYVEEGARPGHRWLCWPIPAQRAYILHLVPYEGSVWKARLTFRDRLRQSAALRQRYATLKRQLAQAHPNDLNTYTAGKRAFVEKVLGSPH